MNYVVDYRLNGDEGAPNFGAIGFGSDFQLYKNSVFLAGDFMLKQQNPEMDIKAQKNQTGFNTLIQTYIKIAGKAGQ